MTARFLTYAEIAAGWMREHGPPQEVAQLGRLLDYVASTTEREIAEWLVAQTTTAPGTSQQSYYHEAARRIRDGEARGGPRPPAPAVPIRRTKTRTTRTHR